MSAWKQQFLGTTLIFVIAGCSASRSQIAVYEKPERPISSCVTLQQHQAAIQVMGQERRGGFAENPNPAIRPAATDSTVAAAGGIQAISFNAAENHHAVTSHPVPGLNRNELRTAQFVVAPAADFEPPKRANRATKDGVATRQLLKGFDGGQNWLTELSPHVHGRVQDRADSLATDTVKDHTAGFHKPYQVRLVDPYARHLSR